MCIKATIFIELHVHNLMLVVKPFRRKAQRYPGEARRAKERPAKRKRTQKSTGERRNTGERRRAQESSPRVTPRVKNQTGKPEESSGEPRRAQESAGECRRTQESAG